MPELTNLFAAPPAKAELNVEEAEDSIRERTRHEMREPYRTLLGHFRHEIGHYYWDHLVPDTPWLEKSRELFGDERQDYAASLKRNYEHGPPANWGNQYISAYASVHPWEDWAESWAHYLHVVDSLDTALGFAFSHRLLTRSSRADTVRPGLCGSHDEI